MRLYHYQKPSSNPLAPMWKLSIAVFSVVFVALSGASLHAQRSGLTVRVDGVELASGRLLSIVIDGDTDNPDAAVVVLIPDAAPTHFFGRGLDLATIDGENVFNGEIIEAAATVDRSGRSIVTIRALNRAHRLTLEKRTRTFEGRSDADIARQLALESGLQAETGTEVLIQHDHVYQQNQTDLEFLMERASRIGYEVFVDQMTLHFRRRRASVPTAIGCQPEAVLLDLFLAKLSSASSAVEVSVRGWDPVKKEPIIGTARQDVIALSAAAPDADPRRAMVDLGFVEALQTGATSYAAALGTLSALTARNLSSEMRVEGSAALRVRGTVILQGVGSAFDGEYHVTQTSHRLGGSGEGWHTLLRLVRADRALFVLPEVGDEVLVAFEHGDVDQPIIVGSLWNPAAIPSSSPCGPRRN